MPGGRNSVRRIQLNGKKIKELRDQRDRAATQKEFAHEIRVSERRLRAIENADAPVTSDIADRIARALNKPLQTLLAQDGGATAPPRARSGPAAEPGSMRPTRNSSATRPALWNWPKDRHRPHLPANRRAGTSDGSACRCAQGRPSPRRCRSSSRQSRARALPRRSAGFRSPLPPRT